MKAFPTTGSERVLVVAPMTKDAELTRSILAAGGLGCHVCVDVRDAARELGKGAGRHALHRRRDGR